MVLTCPTVSTECVSRNQAFIERKGDLINLAKVFSPQEVALRYQTTPYITVLLLRNCSFSFRSPKFLSFAEKIYNQQMDWRERGGRCFIFGKHSKCLSLTGYKGTRRSYFWYYFISAAQREIIDYVHLEEIIITQESHLTLFFKEINKGIFVNLEPTFMHIFFIEF